MKTSRKVLLAIAASSALFASAPAFAYGWHHGRGHVGFYVGGPVYYAPPPVYYAPPVVYAPPVAYAPAPYYYGPQVVIAPRWRHRW